MAEDLSYQILGERAQILEINLEPGKALIADGGALLYLDEEVFFETRPDDGAGPLEEEPEVPGMSDDFLENPENIDEPEPEEPTQDRPLIHKLWVATKKAVERMAQKAEKEKDEFLGDDLLNEEEGPGSLDDLLEDDSPAPFSWYITHFENQSDYVRKVAFTTANSGTLIKVDMDAIPGSELIVQHGSFLCAALGTRLDKFIDTDQSITFTRENFYKLDRVRGRGLVFLQAEGHILEKELEHDTIRVNLFSLIAFESSLQIDLNMITPVQSMHYEEDIQFVTLSGQGKYWLQSATLQQMVYRLTPFIFEPPPEDPPPPIGSDLSEEDLEAGLGGDLADV